MPRGCDNPRSLFNNRPSPAPWTWSATRWFYGDHTNENASNFVSTRHALKVVKSAGWKVITKDGDFLRGANGRPRSFRSWSAAQLAADVEAKVS